MAAERCKEGAMPSCASVPETAIAGPEIPFGEVQQMNGCSGVVLSMTKEWVLNLLLCSLIALLCSTP
jgi:hypothetical protein